MGGSDLTKRPRAGTGDAVHTAAKMVISLVPYIGGPAAELFAAIITPPLTRRRDDWVEAVAKGLGGLHEKVDDFNLDSLQENETFITTLLHASQEAIRSHQKEKLEALRNAVLNAALPNAPEEDIQAIFLNFVDDFTPWHLRILEFFDDSIGWGVKNGITYPKWGGGGPSAVLEHGIPELRGRREFYDLIAADLSSEGLLASNFLHTTMTARGMFASFTTDFGKQFLKFIAAPIG